MNNNVLNDFTKDGDVDKKIISKYSEYLPEELISVWNKYGFGSFLNGYLKVINPEDYKDILERSYSDAKTSIPVFVTAFGDIITWEKNKYLNIVYMRYGRSEVMLDGIEFFFSLLGDEPKEFNDDFFSIGQYKKAVKAYGTLSYDECFGYAPLLALGGAETVKNIKTVKIKEYLELIIQVTEII